MADEDREHQYEKYKFEHDLTRFYDEIIDARLQTGHALSQYKAAQKNIGKLDVQEELNSQSQTKIVFKHHLDRYYDLVGKKFSKSDEVERPDKVKEKEDEEGYFTPHDLSVEECIKLYKKLNELLEELEITSLEDLDKGRRKI